RIAGVRDRRVRPAVSEPAGPSGCRLPARRPGGHRRAAARAEDERVARPGTGGREPCRRRRQPADLAGGEKSARRLHAARAAGEPPIGSLGASGPMAQIKAGRLRGLAVSARARLAALPDVPTLAELGYAIEDYVWIGLFAPAGTPMTVMQSINDAARKAVQLP